MTVEHRADFCAFLCLRCSHCILWSTALLVAEFCVVMMSGLLCSLIFPAVVVTCTVVETCTRGCAISVVLYCGFASGSVPHVQRHCGQSRPGLAVLHYHLWGKLTSRRRPVQATSLPAQASAVAPFPGSLTRSPGSDQEDSKALAHGSCGVVGPLTSASNRSRSGSLTNTSQSNSITATASASTFSNVHEKG